MLSCNIAIKFMNGCGRDWEQFSNRKYRGKPGLSNDSFEINLETTTVMSRTALGPTQPPIQWVTGALSAGLKRPRREADHSPPSSAEVKDWVEQYLHSHNTP
jgi:hypothetical protein